MVYLSTSADLGNLLHMNLLHHTFDFVKQSDALFVCMLGADLT